MVSSKLVVKKERKWFLFPRTKFTVLFFLLEGRTNKLLLLSFHLLLTRCQENRENLIYKINWQLFALLINLSCFLCYIIVCSYSTNKPLWKYLSWLWKYVLYKKIFQGKYYHLHHCHLHIHTHTDQILHCFELNAHVSIILYQFLT